MGAGEDIRSGILAGFQAVPGLDESLILKYDVVASYNKATQAKPTPTPTTIVSFGQVGEVRNLSVEKANALIGNHQVGDREFLVPAGLVTKAQLATSGAYLTYGSETLDLVRYDPMDISFGVVGTWRLVGRVRPS